MSRLQYANSYSRKIGTIGYYINKHASSEDNTLSKCTTIKALLKFLDNISIEAEDDGYPFKGNVLLKFKDLRRKVKNSNSFANAWLAVFNMGAAGDGDRVITSNNKYF